MKLNVYCLYNKKVGAYNSPTYSNIDKEDTFTSLCRYCILNKNTAIEQHFDECEAYFLGYFDDQLGEFDLLNKPEFLGDLAQCFKE